MDKNFRAGEVTSFGKRIEQGKEKDQLEKEFTSGEIMPKERYLQKKRHLAKDNPIR
ncbi:MAG: hypothetical protein SCK28_08980 [Bacillota bacterium]|nr:hypothetical protein [Bacillota bacterium]